MNNLEIALYGSFRKVILSLQPIEKHYMKFHDEIYVYLITEPGPLHIY